LFVPSILASAPKLIEKIRSAVSGGGRKKPGYSPFTFPHSPHPHEWSGAASEIFAYCTFGEPIEAEEKPTRRTEEIRAKFNMMLNFVKIAGVDRRKTWPSLNLRLRNSKVLKLC
jgi:hypothetical protein